MSLRREELRDVLRCPQCRVALESVARGGLACGECPGTFKVVEGVPFFRAALEETAETEYLEGLRGRLRRQPTLYRWIFRLLAPVLVTGPNPARRFQDVVESGIVIDLGAGNDRRHPKFVNVDMLPYPEVDLVADADALPLAEGCAAGMLSIAVLEHVVDPEALLAEARRVVAAGGKLFLAVPFLQPFHAAPHDYRRWTLPGLRAEVEKHGFRVTDGGVYCGPASAVTWVTAAWLAHLLSLGIAPLQRLLDVPLQVVCSPLKWLDLLLARLPGAEHVASVVYVEAVRT